MPALAEKYLEEGTFYVQLLTNKVNGAEKFREYFAKPVTVDTRYAHMGITSTLGHPFMAYEPFALGFSAGKKLNRTGKLF